MKHLLVTSLVALSAMLPLVLLTAACGGGNSPKADVVIDLKAENMRFSPDRVEIPAGKTVMLRMKNMDKNEHDFEVGGMKAEITSGGGHGMDMKGGMTAVAMHTQAGKNASVTFMTNEKGTYDFYCTITGHKESGMVGKLVVTSGASGTLIDPAPKTAVPAAALLPSTTAPPEPQISFGDGGHEGH